MKYNIGDVVECQILSIDGSIFIEKIIGQVVAVYDDMRIEQGRLSKTARDDDPIQDYDLDETWENPSGDWTGYRIDITYPTQRMLTNDIVSNRGMTAPIVLGHHINRKLQVHPRRIYGTNLVPEFNVGDIVLVVNPDLEEEIRKIQDIRYHGFELWYTLENNTKDDSECECCGKPIFINIKPTGIVKKLSFDNGDSITD